MTTGMLRKTLSDLTQSFATAVLAAVRSAPLHELLAERGGGLRAPSAARQTRVTGGRPSIGRRRRSTADLQGVVDSMVKLLRAHPTGLRSEQIRARLGLAANEMPRPIAMALSNKKIRKTGEKRATTYFAR
jgi:hypothetical protein